ncbi:hypothetical protein [Ornithinimicrobium murale]|uniref:hypothetical protein n=1 Tax=Ornithinimicrobium murale TaxID=1050153 RepID=UPI000E0D604F|nr:hypothetical protein [Ornithinimicrobium murale]
MAGVPTLFDLTPLTREAADKRRVVVQGWDVDRRVFILFLIGLAPAAILTGVSFPFIGQYALLVFFATYVPIFWLILGRSSKGMETANWRSLLDKRQSNKGHFILRGNRLEKDRHQPRLLVGASRPGPGLASVTDTDTSTTTDDIFA